MRLVKRLAMLCIMMALAVSFSTVKAASSPQKTKLQNCTHEKTVYDGKTKKVISAFFKSGRVYTDKDYKITKIVYKGKTVKAIKNAGTYTVTVKGAGKYTGTTTFKVVVKKASSALKVKKAKKVFKKKALKKVKKTFKIGAKSKTKKKYAVVGKKAKKYIKVSKAGKVTVKKKAPKGTYKIKVTSVGTANYKKTTKTVKVVVK